MFRTIAEIILKSKIGRENPGRKKQFLSWHQVHTVALILYCKDNVNKSALDKFIDGTGKLVSVFYVETGAKLPTYSDWHCLTKKDGSFLGLPNEKTRRDLQKKKYDLVINTCPDSDIFSVALVSDLNATLKCSNGKKYNESDLIVKKGDPYHVIDYLNEVVRYLNMIRN